MNKKATAFTALALILALALTGLGCACTGGKTPSATDAPSETAKADDRYKMTHYIRYWPEDADYDSCDYACVIELPEFSKTYTSGSNMNKAVDAYVKGLEERIENVYMKSSVAKPPATEVACSVEYARGFTNVVFTEKHSYEAQPYFQTQVLILNERGEEANLCDLFLDYHTEELIAGLIADETRRDPALYDSELDDVLPVIDINHGARVTDEGCTVYVREGLLAPIDAGELEFNIPFDAVKPVPVQSGAVTHDEYIRLTELLRYAADAVIVREEAIEQGSLSPYAATSFMAELCLSMDFPLKAGRIEVEKERFLSLYRSCFGAEFPGIDPDAHDIKEADNAYSISAGKKEYAYNVDVLSATRSGDDLELSGDIIFGDFGYAFTSYVCHVDVSLTASPDAPLGFMIRDFRLRL